MSTQEEFKKNAIVPDIIPKAPEKRVRVAFESGVEASLFYILIILNKSNIKANLGNVLTVSNLNNSIINNLLSLPKFKIHQK